LLAQRDWHVVNADLTLIAQGPKIAALRDRIRTSIADMLGVAVEQVNVKATTPEHLGALGRAEGLAAMATVLLTPTARREG
jgi:2-C-methyl-D-erythritol 2,4-cyclodiphosphate synthase